MSLSMSCKRFGGLLALFLLFVAAPVLRADTLTWDWSFTSSFTPGPHSVDHGGGTITTSTLPSGNLIITAITGTWDGDAITGLASHPSVNDQLTSSGDLGKHDGFSFEVETTDKHGRPVYTEWTIEQDGNHIEVKTQGSGPSEKGTFCATLDAPPSTSPVPTSPAPEPSSIVLLGTALMALGSLVWYRKQNTTAITAA